MRLPVAILGATLLAGSSGLAFAQGMMTDAQIQQKLQSEGYANVQVKKHDKDHIDVTAMKNGKAEKLAVNPQTGAVMPDAKKDDDD